MPPKKTPLIADEFLKFKKQNRGPVQIAFYGGNFFGLETGYMLSMLNEARKLVEKKKVESIRFSTRPDTITKEKLKMISRFPVSTIEIGVQSMDNQVLKKAGRGHTCEDTEQAFGLLREPVYSHYKTGAQLMVGLPGDDEAKAMASCRRIANLSPDFVRIYPTLVIKDSLLAKWYQKGIYCPWPVNRAVTLVKKMYLFFTNRNIKVIRMGLQASSDLEKGSTVLAGPYHPAFGHMVFSEIFLDRAETILNMQIGSHTEITIKVHPDSASRMRGLKNRNIRILKQRHAIKKIHIIPDSALRSDACLVSW